MQTHLLSFRRADRDHERARLIDEIGRCYRSRWGVDLAVDITDWTVPQLLDLADGLGRRVGSSAANVDRHDLAQSA